MPSAGQDRHRHHVPLPAMRGGEVPLLVGPSDVNPATELDVGVGMACASGKENLPAGRRHFTVEPWIPTTAMRWKPRDLAARPPGARDAQKARQNHATTTVRHAQNGACA
jgi:hypothetical protein